MEGVKENLMIGKTVSVGSILLASDQHSSMLGCKCEACLSPDLSGNTVSSVNPANREIDLDGIPEWTDQAWCR